MSEKIDKADLNNKVVEVLKSCYDPEIPVNIYELGLIYGVDIDDEGNVNIKMTLTSPACPVAGSLPPEVESKVRKIPYVKSCVVGLVWEPLWGIQMMSEEARLQLGLY
jgi:FeS assembly SUF system protein